VGLDPAARRAVWDHIEELRDRIDATIILTTHQMEEADILCSGWPSCTREPRSHWRSG